MLRLTADPQWDPARGHNAQSRRRPEQCRDVAGGCKQLFDVVEHDQRIAITQALGECLDRVVGAADLARDLGPHQPGVGDRGEVDEVDAAGEPVGAAVGERQGQARLAAAARPGEREEAFVRVGEPFGERIEFRVSSDEAAGRTRDAHDDRCARCPNCRSNHVEILGEHRALQFAQRGTRVDAELLGENRSRAGVRGDRIGLPVTAIQRDHQLAPHALTERVGSDECLELADELVVQAEGKVALHAFFESGEVGLVEAHDLRLGERFVAQVGEGWAAPQCQRFVQRVGRVLRTVCGELAATACHQSVEAVHVDHIRIDLEQVARPAAHDDQAGRVLQGASQCGYVHLQSAEVLLACVVTPNAGDQAFAGDHAIRRKGEHREY